MTPDEPDLTTLLRQERERTTARYAALRHALDDVIASNEVAPADDEHDPDGATVAFERQQLAALLAQAVAHLDELDAAEERLRAGVLGWCERCQRRIAAERMRARPAARRCVHCSRLRRD